MAAGLEGNVEGGATSFLPCRFEGKNFCVGFSCFGVITFPHNYPVFHNHSSHIGIRPGTALLGQSESPPHVNLIQIFTPTMKKIPFRGLQWKKDASPIQTLTVGSGISPDQLKKLAGYTAGSELHRPRSINAI